MSLTCETFCEEYEDLFEQAPDLRKDQVMVGSNALPLLLSPDDLNDHYGDQPNFFEYVEETFGLPDPLFTRLREQDSAAVVASDAVHFLTRLLEIVDSHGDALPPIYSFRQDQTDAVYLEMTMDGTTVQGGYNHCVAVTGQTVEDLRGRESYSVKDRHVRIVRESVADLLGRDFAAMLEVAKTAQRFNRRFVAEVS